MNYDEVFDQVPEDARPLPAITACLDADYHELWLHEPTATVYHAECDDNGNWTLTTEPAEDAADWIRDPLGPCLDAVADGSASESDREAVDELGDIELAALRAGALKRAARSPIGADREPDQRQLAVTVDELLRGRIEGLRAELARVRRLRARHIQDSWETHRRGGAAEAARDLGVDPAAISRLLQVLEEGSSSQAA